MADFFNHFLVQGYWYDKTTLAYAGEIRGFTGSDSDINSLVLRDHGLAGGEIQIRLNAENHVDNDEGCWYAFVCERDPAMESAKGRDGEVGSDIGRIRMRRMNDRYERLGEREAVLEELDNGHLIDRLRSEALHWHAETFGPGPFSAPVPARVPPRVRR